MSAFAKLLLPSRGSVVSLGSAAYRDAVNQEPFDACWQRLDRADAHRREAIDIWNDYIAQYPCQYALDHEGSGVHILRVWREHSMPAELAVVTGEWFYSLRCTLDYIIWATAVHLSGSIPPPAEGVLQYPIYDSEKAWNSNLRRLAPLADHHRAMLREMQPFASNADANYLGWINQLARIDRHRHLSVMTSYLAELKPVTALPEGCSAQLQWGSRVLGSGKTEVPRVVVEPWQHDMQVEINPRSTIDPEIEDWSASPFWRRISYSERFTMMQAFVAGEVAVYEYDSTGATRKADLLTLEFRAESDRRRPPARPVASERPVTVWSAPVAGKPALRSQTW